MEIFIPAYLAALGISAHRPDLIANLGLEQQPPDKKGDRKGEKESRVEPQWLWKEPWKHSGFFNNGGDRPIPGRFHRTIQKPIAEPESDPVHHDRIDHLMCAGFRLQPTGYKCPKTTGDGTSEQRKREGDINRQSFKRMSDESEPSAPRRTGLLHRC